MTFLKRSCAGQRMTRLPTETKQPTNLLIPHTCPIEPNTLGLTANSCVIQANEVLGKIQKCVVCQVWIDDEEEEEPVITISGVPKKYYPRLFSKSEKQAGVIFFRVINSLYKLLPFPQILENKRG